MKDGDTGVVKKKRGRPKGRKNSKPYTVSEKALAQRQNNMAVKPANTPEEMSYNARNIEHIMRVHEISINADRNDLVSLKSCFAAYLRLCQEDGFPVTNLAAYASMGFDNTTFAWFAKKDDPEIKQFCSFIKQVCAMARETNVASGRLNPVIGIFWQRNFDGLRNDTEQIQAVQEQDDDYRNGSSGYKEKYKKLIGGD